MEELQNAKANDFALSDGCTRPVRTGVFRSSGVSVGQFYRHPFQHYSPIENIGCRHAGDTCPYGKRIVRHSGHGTTCEPCEESKKDDSEKDKSSSKKEESNEGRHPSGSSHYDQGRGDYDQQDEGYAHGDRDYDRRHEGYQRDEGYDQRDEG